MQQPRLAAVLTAILTAGAGGALPGAAPARAAAPQAAIPARVAFNRDVRPILSDKCFFCHGPDKGKRKAGLRLDDRETALKKEAIVPSKPNASEVWKRITSLDPEDMMPPPDTHKKLTDRDKAVLRRWIEQGAAYEPHWAYVPVERPVVPKVKNISWVANPIDSFVGEKLEERGLGPAPPADKRTLLRRLSLDLIGLPPTPNELKAFLADSRPSAYERQVDRLLASPHYGERMAIPWLDVVRFSDTVGYHGDQNQNVFPYREYVIGAFNKNKPFTDFTLEQLAGDLLPNPSTEQLVATGFNRLNMVTREGGAQPKEYLAKYAADRVRTVGGAWLGTTTGCAECHDHKYDPFTQRDFYSLGAFFADVRQWGVYSDYKYTPNPDLKGWSNEHPFPPEIAAESDYLKRRIAATRDRIASHLKAAQAKVAASGARARFETWRKAAQEFVRAHPDGWQPFEPRFVIAKNESARLYGPLVVLRTVKEPDGKDMKENKAEGRDETRAIEARPGAGWLTSLRLDLVPRPEHQGSLLRDGRDSAQLKVIVKVLSAGREVSLPLAHADATAKAGRFDNGFEVHGVATGWGVLAGALTETQTAIFQLAEPVALDDGDVVSVTVAGGLVGALRVSGSPFPVFGVSGTAPRIDRTARTPALPDLAELLKPAFGGGGGAASERAAARTRLDELYLLGPGLAAEERKRFWALYTDLLDGREGRSPTLVTVAWDPLPMRVLPRGNWQDESGPLVEPATPHFLPVLDEAARTGAAARRLTRLDLARWLTWRKNPLTARVFVNRLWKQVFGAGLSSQLNDLGAQGEPPTHPELLDWLAAEFMETGWDVKRLHKLIVTSSTYRQDSRLRPEHKEADPQNRLLARQSPRRLEAELVRDNALFISGLLNLDIGGPSARPYQPAGYYENLQFPSRDYHPHKDDRQWRRGVYMHWQRTFLHPMLANFDAPSREECTADRVVSNTPQQALTLLNDPTFVEAARVFAARLLRDRAAHGDAERLDRAFERAVGRAPRPEERGGLLKLLGEQRELFAAEPESARKLVRVGDYDPAAGLEAAELAAWASVCRVLLNLNETITRY